MGGAFDREDQGASLRSARWLIAVSLIGLILVGVGLVVTVLQVANSVDHDHFSRERGRVSVALAAFTQVHGPLTPDLVQQFGAEQALSDIKLSAVSAVGNDRLSVPVTANAGSVASTVSWETIRPGTTALTKYAPLRVPLILMVAALIGFVLFYLNRLAWALDLERGRAVKLAGQDPLTGLANRLRFDAVLKSDLNENRQGLGLLYLDLDGFKAVNDRLGHAAGDAVLQTVAQRLCSVVPEDALIARLGGDEFAVLSSKAIARNELETLADAIVETIEKPYQFGTMTAKIGVSIGIAIADRRQRSAQALLALADSALYRAKVQSGSARRFAADTESRNGAGSEAA
ncbi:GGDEF domain-containing protein [Devosia rhodophyticola]|uniref:GGDEF domain-containing protein n=1 Tax=Devosia rhodophyticola TaxID=3026423 RepID=A0ABY7Z0Y7_9HYPH|nr:GGDEF domain-containing protein [Devosia rhodophyticola]WDR07186.1 GGDEF domain-containing protein [Devosia rhodophyticola]